ncbi:MAG TPA: holo-ACP synthase [Bryobacteraceae bacterium]|nr:holo-ACP synthase [Bryobacteraceae bacterium]
MILGIGSDLAEVARIRASRARFGSRFLQRIYTEAEARYALSKANADERLAGRFAAKEAGMKAIGTGLAGGVTWKDFEVTRDQSGKPSLRLSGAAAGIAARKGIGRIHLTITHTPELAMAVVVMEE